MPFYVEILFGKTAPYEAWDLNNYSTEIHFHRAYEMILVLEGSIIYHIDGRDYEVEVGDIIIAFPNQLHSVTPVNALTKNVRITVIQFLPDLVGRFSTKYKNLVPRNNILKDIALPSLPVHTKNEFFQKSILYQILGYLSEIGEFMPATMTGNYKLLHQMLFYIENHYMEICNLSALSLQMGYDYAYLSRIFRKHLNCSFTQYLNKRRIYRALELLATCELPMAEIAYQCGYENSRNFNRVFRKQMGMSPGQFRKKRLL